ncbi:Ca(2+)-dependent cysteine protease [Ceratobasidium sp. 428]|nr:Ca(2+)-dependent cysteine protease [Ceratobasidium sp. 428]
MYPMPLFRIQGQARWADALTPSLTLGSHILLLNDCRGLLILALNFTHRVRATVHLMPRSAVFRTRRTISLLPWDSSEPKKPAQPPTAQDIEDVGLAISQGDRLGTIKPVSSSTGVKRRALIVAPRYEDHALAKTQDPLPMTLRDAKLMYNTLTGHDYKPGNIRILADGYSRQFCGLTDPTRSNILNSLDWLVEGTRPGDFRFFYFSGHGQRRPGKIGEGKRARVVFDKGAPDLDDTERFGAGRTASKRLLIQKVPEKNLVYYTQAIITTLSPTSYDEATSGVSYKELNSVFAKLPPGSNLTCVMDCCASGRILNNAIKVAGAGFRGTKPGSTIQKLKKKLGSPPKVDMKEELLPEELELDRITANVLTWASCHQRQESIPYSDKYSNKDSGLFTRGMNEDKNITVGGLYDLVSERTLKLSIAERNWQYVQLWTSIGYNNNGRLSELLDKPVII